MLGVDGWYFARNEMLKSVLLVRCWFGTGGMRREMDGYTRK